MDSDSGTAPGSLAQEILDLESETFEITDYADPSEVMNGSTCSSTCSSSSCSKI